MLEEASAGWCGSTTEADAPPTPPSEPEGAWRGRTAEDDEDGSSSSILHSGDTGGVAERFRAGPLDSGGVRADVGGGDVMLSCGELARWERSSSAGDEAGGVYVSAGASVVTSLPAVEAGSSAKGEVAKGAWWWWWWWCMACCWGRDDVGRLA
jgi:hypothetical protein